MQNNIKRIIAVLNSFEMADAVLKKTFRFAQKFSAAVEVLYVHETPFFALPDYFQTSGSTDNTLDKEALTKEIQKKISAIDASQRVAILVKIDDTEDRVWALAKEDRNTLIITSYHDKISKRLVNKLSQPILVLKNAHTTYHKLALILDASTQSTRCIQKVKEIFDADDMHLVYDYRYVVDPSMEIDLQNVQIIQEAQRKTFENIKNENSMAGEFFVDGSFLGDDLGEYLEKEAYDIVDVCSHGDDFFASDTLAQELLEKLSCDVLVASKFNRGDENE